MFKADSNKPKNDDFVKVPALGDQKIDEAKGKV